MARWITLGAVTAASALGVLGIDGTFSATESNSAAVAVQARRIAVEFFRSQNERRYATTCRLLSDGFIKSHALRDRPTCTAVMRVVFVWSGKIDFRIGRVSRRGDRVVVQAVADGSPGSLVLVHDGGQLRILAVEGG